MQVGRDAVCLGLAVQWQLSAPCGCSLHGQWLLLVPFPPLLAAVIRFPLLPLLLCPSPPRSKCLVAQYCSTACSHADWREGGHRRMCRALGVARQAAKEAAAAAVAADAAVGQEKC